MHDRMRKWRLAGELFRDQKAAGLEDRSLAAALAAVRRRKRRRIVGRWSVSTAVAAALLVAAAVLTIRLDRPEITCGLEPTVPSLVVRSRPVADEIVVRSRPAPGIETSRGTVPALSVVRTDLSQTSVTVVASHPSKRIEFWNDRQLLAALAGRPVMLETTGDGERRLRFLEERDRNLLWEPN